MRKTIDEIKVELSTTSPTTSFRALSLEEQSSVWGKRSQFTRKVANFFLKGNRSISKTFFSPSK